MSKNQQDLAMPEDMGDDLDEKIHENFHRESIRKYYVHNIPVLKRFPQYVRECIIQKYSNTQRGTLHKQAIKEINDFVRKNAPEKNEKEYLKSIIMDLKDSPLIGYYKVYTDLNRGKYFTQVHKLDERATVNRDLVRPPGGFPDLLKWGLWGRAKFQYKAKGDHSKLNMYEFEPYQTSGIIYSKYIKKREKFTDQEWLDVLIKTMGYDPKNLSKEHKMMFLARLIPFVQPFTNVMEFGAPGTGKSYIYENLSEYSRVILGGKMTPAQLIYNKSTKRNGVIFQKDLICFDEIHKAGRHINKLIPHFQQIMASNCVERGEMEASTDVSLIFQGNVNLQEEHGKLIPKNNTFSEALPKKMYNPEFLDRIHIFIPGWELGRIEEDQINTGFGLLTNYFGKILHRLRWEIYDEQIMENLSFYILDKKGVKKSISLRDKTALRIVISGFLKLLYPHKPELSEDQWKELAEIAISFRQRVVDEVVKIDETHRRSLKYKVISKTLDEAKISVDESEQKEKDSKFEVVSQDIEVKKKSKQKKEKKEKLTGWSEYFEPIVILTDEANYLVKTIPYWSLKLFVEKDAIVYKKNKFIFNNKFENRIEQMTVKSKPLEIDSFTSENQDDQVDYKENEEALENYDKKLKLLKTKMEKFQRFFTMVKMWSIKLSEFPNNTKAQKLILQLEDIIENCKINRQREIISLNEEVSAEIDLITDSNGCNPNILEAKYKRIIRPMEERLEKVKTFTKNWQELYQTLFKASKPLIKQAATLYNKNKRINAPSKKERKEKFKLFAFDVNNLVVSYKEYLKKRNSLMRPIFPWRKITRHFQDGPYKALFFASKNFENEKRRVPNSNGNIKWFIEKDIKSKIHGKPKYVDVDATLSSQTSIYIEKYKDQIEELVFGCGDKDLHHVIEFAKKYSIYVTVMAVHESNLSRTLEKLADSVYLLY